MCKLYLSSFILLLFSLSACHKNGSENLSGLTVSQRQNIVPVKFAKEFARRYKSAFQATNVAKHTSKTTADSGFYSPYEVVGTWTLNDKNNLPALYIFTYGTDKGFSVISADLRYDAVCAYVPDGTYNLDDSMHIPYGLYGWFQETIENIEGVRDSLVNNTALASYQWCRAIDNTNLQAEMENLGVLMSFATLDSQSNIYGYRYSGQFVPSSPQVHFHGEAPQFRLQVAGQEGGVVQLYLHI